MILIEKAEQIRIPYVKTIVLCCARLLLLVSVQVRPILSGKRDAERATAEWLSLASVYFMLVSATLYYSDRRDMSHMLTR